MQPSEAGSECTRMHTDAAIQVKLNKTGECRDERGREVERKFLKFNQRFGKKYADVKMLWEGEGRRF
jgi:hypothetical protein